MKPVELIANTVLQHSIRSGKTTNQQHQFVIKLNKTSFDQIYFSFSRTLKMTWIWKPLKYSQVAVVCCGVWCDQIFRKFIKSGSRFWAQPGRNRFSKILHLQRASLAETSYGLFVFGLGRIYERNRFFDLCRSLVYTISYMQWLLRMFAPIAAAHL